MGRHFKIKTYNVTMSEQKANLARLKKSSIYQALTSSPDTEISAPSAAEIAEITPLIKSLSNMKLNLAIALNLGSLGCAIAAIVLMLTSEQATVDVIYVLAAFGGCAVMHIGKWMASRYFECVEELNQGLEPLKDVEACERALQLVAIFPVLNNYRQSVLSQGREFLCLDLALMEKRADVLKVQADSDYAQQVCKKLHDVPA